MARPRARAAPAAQYGHGHAGHGRRAGPRNRSRPGPTVNLGFMAAARLTRTATDTKTPSHCCAATLTLLHCANHGHSSSPGPLSHGSEVHPLNFIITSISSYNLLPGPVVLGRIATSSFHFRRSILGSESLTWKCRLAARRGAGLGASARPDSDSRKLEMLSSPSLSRDFGCRHGDGDGATVTVRGLPIIDNAIFFMLPVPVPGPRLGHDNVGTSIITSFKFNQIFLSVSRVHSHSGR
jgi:hypothetical protein